MRGDGTSRRAFLKDCGRFLAYAGLGLLAFRLFGGRKLREICVGSGICRGCRVLRSCGLPQALSLKSRTAFR
jgi:hypothetical protein